jgi:hypothetical protein
MKIDVMHALYTVSMIILAFVAALVITKTLSKYLDKKKKNSGLEKDE